jgi:hypothetical protein
MYFMHLPIPSIRCRLRFQWKRANDALPKRHLAQDDRQVDGKPVRALPGRRILRRVGRSVHGSPDQNRRDRGRVIVLGQHATVAISVALKNMLLDSSRRCGLTIRQTLPQSGTKHLAITIAQRRAILRGGTSH